MPERINWTIDVQVSGGPKILTSQSIAVEAYDSIKVTVLGTGDPPVPLDADTNKEVQVQPGGSGAVSFLAITSNRYDTGLTYQVNEEADPSTNPGIALDRPHILVGQGAVSLLDPAPTSLFFSSTIVEDAEIHILVGRDATPSS